MVKPTDALIEQRLAMEKLPKVTAGLTVALPSSGSASESYSLATIGVWTWSGEDGNASVSD